MITTRGIFYEATSDDTEGRRSNWFGRYDAITDTFEERLLPVGGYVHVGLDPAGQFDFIEHVGTRHELLSVHVPVDPDAPLDTRLLRALRSPFHDHQRHHAHPFLSPDRKRLFFTDWDEDGYAQVHMLDVSDLT